jgi:hypothetical protein
LRECRIKELFLFCADTREAKTRPEARVTRKSVQPAVPARAIKEEKKKPKLRGRQPRTKGKAKEEEEEKVVTREKEEEEEEDRRTPDREEEGVKLDRVVQVRVEDCLSIATTASPSGKGDESVECGDVPTREVPVVPEEEELPPPPTEGVVEPEVEEGVAPVKEEEPVQRKEEEEVSEEGLPPREDTEEPGSASQEDDDGPLPATSPFR